MAKSLATKGRLCRIPFSATSPRYTCRLWFHSSISRSTQAGEHGGTGFDPQEEACDLHILIGGVVGLVRVGVGNAKGRDAQGFSENVVGETGPLGRDEERRHTLSSNNGLAQWFGKG